jgi:hypothetical protein
MTYVVQVWADNAAGGTPITADRLNYMEAGIAGAGGGTGGGGTIATVPPGATFTVRKDPVTGFWPASYDGAGAPVYTGGSASAGVRPTNRTDVYVIWKGADPSPAIVSSGTAGMLNNVDSRLVTP